MYFLQMFADAGSVVNASIGYVNAYTGDIESFSGNNNLTAELKTFYDTELLENARIEMYYAQFAKKQPLPANNGTTVEWRKWNTFAKAEKLTEGVIPTGQKFGVTKLNGSIEQYGTYTAVTDKLELRAYDDVILGATEEMGASAAETQETLIRDTLLTGTNVLYADKVTVATGAKTPVLYQYDLVYNDTDRCVLTADMVNKARTKMIKDRVPTINGRYYAVIHPSVAYDLRNDPDWIEAHKYAQPTEIYNGEIGELHGVRFIEDTFAPVLAGGDLSASGRNLNVAAAPASSASESPTAGDKGLCYVTVDETLDESIIGRLVYAYDTSASAVVDSAKVVGYGTSKVYLDSDWTTSGASTLADGDFLTPGEGGFESNTSGSNAAYATMFFGRDAYGIIDPAGGALEMIVHDKSEIGGPLNQFSTIGYKFETNGATFLYPERVLTVYSCSAYSDIDTAN